MGRAWSGRQYFWMLTIVSAAYVLLFLRLPSQWWYADDPYLLAHAGSVTSPWAFFVSRDALTKGFVGLQFTPLQNLTYWLDMRLAARSVAFAYGHSAVALWLCVLMLFVVMRRWIGAPAACAVACGMLLLPSTIVVSQWISTRNYVEGLFLALAAVWLAQRALERAGWPHVLLAAAAGVTWWLSGLAKEIYVTTPFALIAAVFLWRRRWAGAVVFMACGAAYVLHYRLVIGSLEPTFNIPTLSAAEYPLFLARLPFIFAGGVAGWALAAVAAVALAAGVRQRWIPLREAMLAAALIVISIATIHPAAGALNADYDVRGSWYRAAFLLWIVVLASAAWLFRNVSIAWRQTLLVAATTALALGAAFTEHSWAATRERHRVEGEFYLSHPDKLLATDLPDWWLLAGLDRLYDVPRSHFVATRVPLDEDAMRLTEFATAWTYSPVVGGHFPSPDAYAVVAARTKETRDDEP